MFFGSRFGFGRFSHLLRSGNDGDFPICLEENGRRRTGCSTQDMSGGTIPKMGAVLDIAGKPTRRDHRKCCGTASKADDMVAPRLKCGLDFEATGEWPRSVATDAKGDRLRPDKRRN